MKHVYINKLKYTLTIFSIFFIMFGLVGPLEIFSGNVNDFEFGFNDFFWMFALIYMLMWIALSAVTALLPKKLVDVMCTGGFALGIACYIQNMLLNKSLMRIDGGRIEWDKLKGYTLFDSIIWIVIIAATIVIALLLKDKWTKVSSYIIVFLCIIQFVAVVSMIITVPKDRHYEDDLKIDATDQFKVAPNENIIVLVCDRFANDQMNEMLVERPENYEIFKDFTYYDNYDGVFCGTDYCMNVMLTGQLPDDSKDDWRQACWKTENVQSFYDILHEHGYTCYIASRDTYNVYGDMALLQGKFDNVRILDVTFDRGLLFRLFTKMTIYKYAPYVVKPKFEVMTYSFKDVIASESHLESLYLLPDYYEGLTNIRFSVDDNLNNLFKVQHIQGLHEDYNFNANCERVPDTEGDIDGMRQGLNCILVEYLDQLKETGMYDSATIIITSDHGDGYGILSLQPTMLIKRPYETHDKLVIDSSPISHHEFMPTVLYWLGEDYDQYGSGTTYYDYRDGQDRERKFTHAGTEYIYYHDGEEIYKKVWGKELE